MSETSKMIKLINKNKESKQESVRIENQKRLAKKEKISNILTFAGYLVATYVFVEIVTLLVK